MLVVAACTAAGEGQESSPVPSTDGTATQVPPVATTGGPSTTEAGVDPPASGCADVVDATVDGSGTVFTVSATVRSVETGWDKYADAWEVRTLDGEVLGTRVLAHPHVDEQPFTRSQGISEVEVAARDLVLGFCGETTRVAVPGR